MPKDRSDFGLYMVEPTEDFFKWIIVYNIDLDFIKNKLLYKYPMHMVLGKEKDDDELLFLLMGSKILSYNLVKGTTREIEINFPSCQLYKAYHKKEIYDAHGLIPYYPRLNPS